MENHQFDVKVKKGDEWINLWFVGDWHIGSVACDEKKIDKDISKILKTEKPHVFYMGDGMDAICYRDKRFDPVEIHPRFRDHLGDVFRWQLKEVRPRIEKLRPYIIGCHIGNHELHCSKYFQYNPHAELLETFPEITNLEWSALTKININPLYGEEYNFTVATWHGVGEIKTMLAFVNRTKHFDADIKVCGHNHQLEFKRVDALTSRGAENGGDVDNKPQVWGFSGSYLRTYASGMIGYGEPRGYEPVPLGCLNIKVRRDAEGRLEFEAKTT